MNKKKGISPLIATVLIIGFTIVLAAVVMNWGGAFVRNLTEEQSKLTQTAVGCMQIKFDIGNATYDSTYLAGTDKVILLKVTSNVEKSIASFIAVVEHLDGNTDSLNSVTDLKKYIATPSGTTFNEDCAVDGFSTKTCKIKVPTAVTMGTTSKDDKLKLIPLLEDESGNVNPCSGDTAVSRPIIIGEI